MSLERGSSGSEIGDQLLLADALWLLYEMDNQQVRVLVALEPLREAIAVRKNETID
jgi:hypothetical protein